jgi:putative hydrolase of the HAD superfamily
MNDPIITPDIRAVFFDAVGTLIEPRPSAAVVYQLAGEAHGIQLNDGTIEQRFSDAFAAEEERDHVAGLRASEGGERDRWRRIVSTVFAGHSSDKLFDELWHWFARPMAWRTTYDVVEVLCELAGRGLALGIASNFDRRLHSVIDGLPELAPIQHRVISSEVGWRKPSQVFFDAIVRATRCEPRQIVFVGDRRDVDYDAANAAGLRGVFLNPTCERPPADRQIWTLGDLL